jgi:hypothetical protein
MISHDRREGSSFVTWVLYNVKSIQTTSGVIKHNATDWQNAVHKFLSSYQTALPGSPPTLNTALTNFISTCQPALEKLGTNRSQLGKILDQVATDAEQMDLATKAQLEQDGTHTK